MDTERVTKLLLGTSVPLLLAGCMAAAIAPVIPLAGGMMDAKILVTLDEKSVTPEARTSITSARRLAVIAGDASSAKAGDYLETNGGYEVSLDRTTAKNGEMTGSERREALRRLCGTGKADIAFVMHSGKSEVGFIGASVVTGRVKVHEQWFLSALDCRRNQTFVISGMVDVDAGIYSNDSHNKLDERIGIEWSKKFLQVFGPQGPGGNQTQPVTAVPSPVVNTPAPTVGSTGTVSAVPPVAQPSTASEMSVTEAQNRLIALGYLRGKADGMAGRMTQDAIRRFQSDYKIQVTGQLNDETRARLSAAKP